MSVYHIAQSQLVFKGEVIDKEIVEEGYSRKYKYTFKVLENIKPVTTPKELVVFSQVQSSMCGVNYEIGESIYIFSNTIENEFHTNDCSKNFRPQGIIRSRRAQRIKGIERIIKDFKNSGIRTMWYDENGILVGIGSVCNGVMEGLWTFFYSDGSLAQKGFFVQGQKEGNWAIYRSKESSINFLSRLDNQQKKLIRNPENIISCIAKYINGVERNRNYVFRG
jgi:antitoxin component YwqK of YwqJK toxin-antitoxin module